jgi:Holliday junction resolvase RusA-like endonuclease
MNWFIVTSPFGLRGRVMELAGDIRLKRYHKMVQLLLKNQVRGFRLAMPNSVHMVLHTLLWKSSNSVNRKLHTTADIQNALRTFSIDASSPEIKRVLKNLLF